MRIQPLKRVVQRPIGYVVDSRRIVGEWSGERWEDVPRKAALYVNDRRDIHRRIVSGELTARVWYRRSGRASRVSGWVWESPKGNVHNLYNLDHTLDALPSHARFAAILEFVDMVRLAGANVGSLGGMMGSVERAVIPKTVRVGMDNNVPASRLWRGSRIQKRGGISAHFGESNLWDMPNAYPMRLAGLRVPSAWREYPGNPRTPIPDEDGIAYAFVVVPWLLYGPLARVDRFRPSFPTDTEMSGLWTLAELRAARDSGARVYILRMWLGTNYRQPWERWGSIVSYMRMTASPGALRLVKKGAVQYVGSLAADGEVKYHRHLTEDSIEIWSRGEQQRPQALTVHGLVTAQVRTDLYADALAPWGAAFVSCHTDGAILLDDESIVVGKSAAEWRMKRKMSEVITLDAQRYAWRDYGDQWHYVYAGVPEKALEPVFWRTWEARLKNRGQDADILLMANGRKGGHHGKRER